MDWIARVDTLEQGLRELYSISVQGEGYRLRFWSVNNMIPGPVIELLLILLENQCKRALHPCYLFILTMQKQPGNEKDEGNLVFSSSFLLCARNWACT